MSKHNRKRRKAKKVQKTKARSVTCNGCGRSFRSSRIVSIVPDIPESAGGWVTCLRIKMSIPNPPELLMAPCPHCNHLDLVGVRLPLDTDLPVLRAFEGVIGGPASQDQKAALVAFIELTEQMAAERFPDEPDAASELLDGDKLRAIFLFLEEQAGPGWWNHLPNFKWSTEEEAASDPTPSGFIDVEKRL